MKKYLASIPLILILIFGYASYFIVNETEQVVITRFGRPVGAAVTTAGMYFKLPLIDKANYFEKRILEWDGDPNQIPTKDKKNIMVDATARWKIVDPLVFLQSIGNETAAQTRLDDIIDSSVRNIITNYDLIDIVRNSDRVIDVIQEEYMMESFAVIQDQEAMAARIQRGREWLTRDILEKSRPIIKSYGIDLIDVRVKGLMYSSAVLETVYQRMISQYGIKAQNLRSEGDKKKSKIEGDTEFDVKTISSEAYRKAQTTRGAADAEATRIYAEALQADPEFYHFQRSLEAYDKGVDKNSTLIIGADSEFFRVLINGDQ